MKIVYAFTMRIVVMVGVLGVVGCKSREPTSGSQRPTVSGEAARGEASGARPTNDPVALEMVKVPVPNGVTKLDFEFRLQDLDVDDYRRTTQASRGLDGIPFVDGLAEIPKSAHLHATLAGEITPEIIEWSNTHRIRLSVACSGPLPATVRHLDCTSVDDKGIAAIATLQSLESLHISIEGLGATAATLLGEMTELRYLDLRYRGGPTPALTKLTKLEVLLLDGESAVALDKLTALRTLDLSLAPVDDAAMATIGTLAELRVLDLPSTITAEGFGHLAALPLESLGYFGGELSPASLDAIARIKTLRGLSATKSTLPALDALAALTALEVLDLRHSTVDASALETFRRLPKLRHLYVRKTAFGAEQCAALPRNVHCDLVTTF